MNPLLVVQILDLTMLALEHMPRLVEQIRRVRREVDGMSPEAARSRMISLDREIGERMRRLPPPRV